MADKGYRGQGDELVVNLPDTDELKSAGIKADDYEKIVTRILDDEGQRKQLAGSYKLGDKGGGGIERVKVRGRAGVARAAGIDVGAIDDPGTWIKTIWRRFCFTSAS